MHSHTDRVNETEAIQAVIPAHAGIQKKTERQAWSHWIPACARMTRTAAKTMHP